MSVWRRHLITLKLARMSGPGDDHLVRIGQLSGDADCRVGAELIVELCGNINSDFCGGCTINAAFEWD